MIAHLNGTVCSVAPDGAVIDVGGVGLLVQCTPGTLAGLRPGERARVATSLVVREDALTLYGFAGEDERNTFELVQTASGVGPRLALAMLAVFSPDALRRAVAAEDLAALTTVPGIGRKGAQRIVLELAGRLGSPGDGGMAGDAGMARAGSVAPWREQVRAGLMNLGWQARDAEQAIAAVEPELLAAGRQQAGDLPDGLPPDGLPPDGHAAGGHAAGGHAAGGHAAGGHAAGGHAADGHAADGHAADGHAADSRAADSRTGGSSADGQAVDVGVALRAALRVLGRT